MSQQDSDRVIQSLWRNLETFRQSLPQDEQQALDEVLTVATSEPSEVQGYLQGRGLHLGHRLSQHTWPHKPPGLAPQPGHRPPGQVR